MLRRWRGALVVAPLGLALGLLVLRLTVFQLVQVPARAMVPAILPGEVVLVYTLRRTPSVGEVVLYADDGELRVGRVVAGPGSAVELLPDGLRVDGRNLAEGSPTEVSWPDERCVTRRTVVRGEAGRRVGVAGQHPLRHVSEGWWVLGDNRGEAFDSSLAGPVPAGDVLGVAVGVVRPLGRCGGGVDRIRRL